MCGSMTKTDWSSCSTQSGGIVPTRLRLSAHLTPKIHLLQMAATPKTSVSSVPPIMGASVAFVIGILWCLFVLRCQIIQRCNWILVRMSFLVQYLICIVFHSLMDQFTITLLFSYSTVFAFGVVMFRCVCVLLCVCVCVCFLWLCLCLFCARSLRLLRSCVLSCLSSLLPKPWVSHSFPMCSTNVFVLGRPLSLFLTQSVFAFLRFLASQCNGPSWQVGIDGAGVIKDILSGATECLKAAECYNLLGYNLLGKPWDIS